VEFADAVTQRVMTMTRASIGSLMHR